MTRAVLEGVAFGFKDSFDLMRQAGLGNIEQVRVSGGGARSRFWRQILANTLRVELISAQADEGAAAGAALLAGVGVGVWPDVRSACASAVHLGERVQPDPREAMAYARLHARYQALYPALKATFDGLSEIG
jgi:xylulokinase